jgi:hypothetical protein
MSAGAGASGAGGGRAGSGGSAGNGVGEAVDDDELLLDVGNAAPGVWCGVGLPTLCAMETEKCCDRTLEADSCMPLADRCECDLEGCEVLEARCDGPEDCPDGQFCCGALEADPNFGSRYSEFACATQCSLEMNRPEACHTSDDTCRNGLVCANSQILANVQICVEPETLEQD